MRMVASPLKATRGIGDTVKSLSHMTNETPVNHEEVCEVLRRASAERRKVAPVGHGTKLGMGGAGAPVNMVLSLERMNRICDYPASDLTITVEAGLPIRELAVRSRVIEVQGRAATVFGIVHETGRPGLDFYRPRDFTPGSATTAPSRPYPLARADAAVRA